MFSVMGALAEEKEHCCNIVSCSIALNFDAGKGLPNRITEKKEIHSTSRFNEILMPV